nr:putative invertase inhibitor [Ipomoea batatas]
MFRWTATDGEEGEYEKAQTAATYFDGRRHGGLELLKNKKRFNTANILLSAVMETASTCQEGFAEKEGERAAPPLTEENDNLFQLSDIALCITKLVSREQISGELSHLQRIMEKK